MAPVAAGSLRLVLGMCLVQGMCHTVGEVQEAVGLVDQEVALQRTRHTQSRSRTPASPGQNKHFAACVVCSGYRLELTGIGWCCAHQEGKQGEGLRARCKTHLHHNPAGVKDGAQHTRSFYTLAMDATGR